jgi:MFS family permease
MFEKADNTKTNMILGVINGIFFSGAGAFIHGGVVLPLFISHLSDSKILVGLFSTMEAFGWAFPQLFSGALIFGTPLVLWLYNRMSVIRLATFALILIFTFTLGNQNHWLLLLGFGIAFTIYSLAGGIAGVPFMDIVGKTIPNNKRGTFFGLRIFFGGLVAIVAGPIVKKILGAYSFPVNFGVMFTIAYVFIAAGLACFVFAKEPRSESITEKSDIKGNLLYAYKIYRENINVRRLVLSRILQLCYLTAVPFYVLIATERLNISIELAATYLSFEMAGYLGINFFWAWLSNHISNKKVMQWAAYCSLIPPIIALISLYKNPGYFIYGLVFFFNGASSSGSGLGFLNYLLEIGSDKDRPILVGLVHTLVAPAVFMSIIGGIIIELLDLESMLIITTTCLIISLNYIAVLIEPKRARLPGNQ